MLSNAKIGFFILFVNFLILAECNEQWICTNVFDCIKRWNRLKNEPKFVANSDDNYVNSIVSGKQPAKFSPLIQLYNRYLLESKRNDNRKFQTQGW